MLDTLSRFGTHVNRRIASAHFGIMKRKADSSGQKPLGMIKTKSICGAAEAAPLQTGEQRSSSGVCQGRTVTVNVVVAVCGGTPASVTSTAATNAPAVVGYPRPQPYRRRRTPRLY
jgi:hypothetical protein